MSQNPLQVIESLDPALLEVVESARALALGEGALPVKYKFLIAMALDAAAGADAGVANLARAAMSAGATKQEVAEALRVAYFIDGVGSTYTAAHGLAGVF